MISVDGSHCHIFYKQKAFKDTLEYDKEISENLQPILQLSHQWWTVRDDLCSLTKQSGEMDQGQ
jgi:hypothetical protein